MEFRRVLFRSVDAIWAVGPLTGLVNNAAANFIAPTKQLSPRGFRAITSTVMDGSFHVTLAIGKRWLDAGIRGSVVSTLVTWGWKCAAFVVPLELDNTALHSLSNAPSVHCWKSDKRRGGKARWSPSATG